MSVISLEEWQKKRAKSWESESQSQPNTKWLKLGVDLTKIDYNTQQLIATYATLDLALRKPFKLKSKFARNAAMYVAICASEGWITNAIGEDAWGDRWVLTTAGMETKNNLDGLIGHILDEGEPEQ